MAQKLKVCLRSDSAFLTFLVCTTSPFILALFFKYPFREDYHCLVFMSIILFPISRGFSQTICPRCASFLCFAKLMRSSFSAPGGPISPYLQSMVSALMCKCWSPSGVIPMVEPDLELDLVVVTVSPQANDRFVVQSHLSVSKKMSI